jgi:hypothetical protein
VAEDVAMTVLDVLKRLLQVARAPLTVDVLVVATVVVLKTII